MSAPLTDAERSARWSAWLHPTRVERAISYVSLLLTKLAESIDFPEGTPAGYVPLRGPLPRALYRLSDLIDRVERLSVNHRARRALRGRSR